MNNDTNILQRQLEYRKRFMEKINEIHSAANLNAILLQLKDSIAGLFDAERITIYVADTRQNILISKVKSGEEVRQIAVPIDSNSISGFSALSGTIVNVKNAYDSHELKMINSNLKFDDRWDKKSGFHTTQVLCVPMKFDKMLIGAIGFHIPILISLAFVALVLVGSVVFSLVYPVEPETALKDQLPAGYDSPPLGDAEDEEEARIKHA